MSSWNSFKDVMLPQCILPLDTHATHKGSSGRIVVLGGSALYTGAPYYASTAALQTGADLVTLLTADQAAMPLKCYSPELMVQPVYRTDQFDDFVRQMENGAGPHQGGGNQGNQSNQSKQELTVDMVEQQLAQNDVPPEMKAAVDNMIDTVTSALGTRYHALIVGPGLGRCPLVGYAVGKILQQVRRKTPNMPIILDADSLWCLSHSRDVWQRGVCKGNAQLILTPNKMELKRLQDAIANDNDEWASNVTVVQKGAVDKISVGIPKDHFGEPNEGGEQHNRHQIYYECNEKGGKKRSGGIGDVLAGTIGTMAAWQSILKQQDDKKEKESTSSTCSSHASTPTPSWIPAAWTACHLVKRSTRVAYESKKRAMTAPDVLHYLGQVFDDMIGKDYNEVGRT